MAHDERAQSDRAGPDQSKRATTGHPVQDAIAQRWSPYGFAPRELPAAELRSLLEAARWSASSYNEQPWRFLVARREEGEAFERLVSCLVEFNQSWARHASALLLGVVARDFEGRDKRNPAAEHDLGLATGNLMTEATTRGIAVHAMIGIEADVARERCAIPPGFDPLTADRHRVCGGAGRFSRQASRARRGAAGAQGPHRDRLWRLVGAKRRPASTTERPFRNPEPGVSFEYRHPPSRGQRRRRDADAQPTRRLQRPRPRALQRAHGGGDSLRRGPPRSARSS